MVWWYPQTRGLGGSSDADVGFVPIVFRLVTKRSVSFVNESGVSKIHFCPLSHRQSMSVKRKKG